MKTIYLDCGMGAAGDMLMGALYELLPDQPAFLATMNALGLPHTTLAAEPSVKCGITGTHMRVLVGGEEESTAHSHHHAHFGLDDVQSRIAALPLPEPVRADITAVYRSIADAESRVHGVPVDEIHFHELGTLDALADVAGVCLLMHLLAPQQVICSPIHVGSGHVRCAHGLLPVPAPATALLLQGLPIYGGNIEAELCTPTGAALVRHFATDFGSLPLLRVQKVGYGMGSRDFPAANCVRALLGETQQQGAQVAELTCTLDDMTPEALAFAAEQLLAAGALDVTTTPTVMKKGRAGVTLTCLCEPAQREALVRLLFLHTTTLGIRTHVCERYTLTRQIETVQTPDGAVRVKRSCGWGVSRSKAEYEDLARIARESGRSLAEVRASVEQGTTALKSNP